MDYITLADIKREIDSIPEFPDEHMTKKMFYLCSLILEFLLEKRYSDDGMNVTVGTITEGKGFVQNV